MLPHPDPTWPTCIQVPNLLGRQALKPPGGAHPTVPQTVVKPVAAALPELDSVWYDPVSAPELGQWRRGGMQGLEPGDLDLQRRPVDDDAALRGRRGRDPASVGPRGPVRLRLLATHLRDRSPHPDLAVQQRPVEGEGGPSVGRQVLGLRASNRPSTASSRGATSRKVKPRSSARSSRTMRTDGWQCSSAVASAMALGRGSPASSAQANQRPNSTTASESTSSSLRGWSVSIRSNMNAWS